MMEAGGIPPTRRGKLSSSSTPLPNGYGLLVAAMVAGEWTVEATRRAVAGVKDAPACCKEEERETMKPSELFTIETAMAVGVALALGSCARFDPLGFGVLIRHPA